MPPLVSFCISNHNYGRFLTPMLDALLAQTYEHTEVVVVDDGSTDESRAVLERYRDRITYVTQEPASGQAAACNRAYDLARGDIVVFHDSDDVLHEDAAARLVSAFAADDIVMVLSRLDDIDADGHLTGGHRPPDGCPLWGGDLRALVLGHCAFFWPETTGQAYRRTFLDEVMPIPLMMAPDFYLSHLGAIAGPVVASADPIGCYRVHGRNKSLVPPLHGTAWLDEKVLERTLLHDAMRRVGLAHERFASEDAAAAWVPRDFIMAALRVAQARLERTENARRWGRAGISAVADHPQFRATSRARHVAWFVGASTLPASAARRIIEARFPHTRSYPRAVPSSISARTRVAAALGALTSSTSRRVGRGSGSVIGAKVTLALAPHALDELAAGRHVAIVSGTNGKSTTTAMLAAACASGGVTVASNVEGANLLSGVVSVLGSRRARDTDLAVLEVDELALPALLPSFERPVVVLLNLSRDQLDRFGEVRTVAGEWRRALERVPATVVANADDPLVVWGAGPATDAVFVGVGLPWRKDAASCPNCGRRLETEGADWWCACGLRRPRAYELVGHQLVDPDGQPVVELHPGVPGRHNLANAALAAVAATMLGVPIDVAAHALGSVTSVAGRYRTVTIGHTATRLLLAKNPAGWAELLAMIEGEDRPLILGINARIADGRDPSWLWDVEYERLRGRRVIAAGERAADLAVRLRYAEVDCVVWDEPIAAGLRTFDAPEADVIANYTCFADVVRAVGA